MTSTTNPPKPFYEIEDLEEEEVLEEESTEVAAESPKTGCGILGRYPLASVIIFAIVGVGLGLGLSFWDPEDPNDKDTAIKWIGLIGDLFVRSLKLVILPLVFINVVISVVDMMSIGRAGSIGWKTVILYMSTTFVASVAGIIAIVTFKGLFTEGTFAVTKEATVRLGCSAAGMYMTENNDTSISCTYDESEASDFIMDDVSGTFVKTDGGVESDYSLSDTIYDGVFLKLVSDNLTFAFAEANFAAVVMFAIVFGVALSNVLLEQRLEGKSFVVGFLQELDKCFMKIIFWIIMITPFAVLSLIASAIGGQTNLVDSFENVAYLVLACLFGWLIHHLIVHQLMFWAITRWNPYSYLRALIPAQTLAFSCASSAATIPMTSEAVRSTGLVPEYIQKFVVPLGATINMDGSAVYFPCACVWLAVLNGIAVNMGHYILLVIISTIGSAGTAPVPAAGLVLVLTAYNTVFGTTGTPEGFSYIVAIDFFLDRCVTVMNVTGDAVVCGMISKLCAGDDNEVNEDGVPAKELDQTVPHHHTNHTDDSYTQSC